MTCPIHVGDEFRWTEHFKNAAEGDTVKVTDIHIDEDNNAQVSIINYRGRPELITSGDIHKRVDEGVLERVE